MKWRNLLYAMPLAVTLTALVAGSYYGYTLKKACEASGPDMVYVKVYGHFGNECIKKGK